MKKVTVFLVVFCFSVILHAQNCINTVSRSITTTTPNSGFVEQLSNSHFTDEYVEVSGLIIGHNYRFTSTHQDGTINDYITITRTDNTPILSGLSPLTINLQSVTSIRIHIKANASCGSDFFSHLSTITNLTNAPLACYAPTIIPSDISYRSDKRTDFSWSAPSLSTPVGYNWEIGLSGFSVGTNNEVVKGSTVAPTTSASSGEVLSAGISYDLYIRSDCGSGNESAWLGPINFTTNSIPPPINDFCNGAINIIEQTGKANSGAATATLGDLNGGAGTDVDAEMCNGRTGNARDDMWFSFIAQTTAITITLEPNANVNFIATLYSGNCNSLSYITCSDLNNSNPSKEEITYSGFTVGNTYYLRVYYFNTLTNVDRSFRLKIWSSITTTDADSDGYSNNPNVDCDDTNPAINPGATEIPDNGIDEDCDGADLKTWYADTDMDTYGDSSSFLFANTIPTGYVSNNTDCDDTNPAINPGATEIPDNGIDEDCDGSDLKTWYADTDMDTYGNSSSSLLANTKPTGYVSNNTDCDDTNPAINPGAMEVCDGLDNDCDGMIDDNDSSLDVSTTTLWYQDSDLDGFGDINVSISACSKPQGYVVNSSDNCPSIFNPGQEDGNNNGIGDACESLLIEEFNLEHIDILPNPFNSNIFIDIPQSFSNEKFNINLFDSNGRIVYKSIHSSNLGKINISGLDDLQQGIYLIEISILSKNSMLIKRMVKL